MGWFYLALGVGGLAIVGWYAWTRRQLKRAAAEQLEALHEVLVEDIVLFKEHVEHLTADGSLPEYERMRAAYEFVVQASGPLKNPAEAAAIARELAEGQYAVLRYKAALAGQTPPARRLPCFFNPQHGPSSPMSNGPNPAAALADSLPALKT